PLNSSIVSPLLAGQHEHAALSQDHLAGRGHSLFSRASGTDRRTFHMERFGCATLELRLRCLGTAVPSNHCGIQAVRRSAWASRIDAPRRRYLGARTHGLAVVLVTDGA